MHQINDKKEQIISIYTSCCQIDLGMCTVHTNKYAMFTKHTTRVINWQYTTRDFIAVMIYLHTLMLVSLEKWCIFIMTKSRIPSLKVYKFKSFVLAVILTINTIQMVLLNIYYYEYAFQTNFDVKTQKCCTLFHSSLHLRGLLFLLFVFRSNNIDLK